jgi:type VI secretion system Hcp family effector
MSYYGFLKIEGITGGSQTIGHTGEMEISKWGQHFSYGKQHLGDAVNKFDIALKNEKDEEFNELKALNPKIPNFEKLQKYHKNGDKTKEEIIEYDKMIKDFKNWHTNYQKTLNKLKKKLDRDKVIDKAFSNFTSFISEFKGELNNSNHDSMKFDKTIDTASAQLLEFCCIGKKIPTCTFSLYRSIIPSSSGIINLAEKKEVNNFIEVILKEVYIRNYSINGDSNIIPTEKIELNYDEITFNFVEGNALKGTKGNKKTINWKWESGTAKTA